MIRYSEVNWSTPGVKQNRIDNNIEGGKPLAFIIELNNNVDKKNSIEILEGLSNIRKNSSSM